jgi:hypothetical protein
LFPRFVGFLAIVEVAISEGYVTYQVTLHEVYAFITIGGIFPDTWDVPPVRPRIDGVIPTQSGPPIAAFIKSVNCCPLVEHLLNRSTFPNGSVRRDGQSQSTVVPKDFPS